MKRNNKIVATLILSALTILSLCIFSFADPPGPPAPPTISGTPPEGTVGVSYSFTPTSTNATGLSYSGTLPQGLSFSNGSVSGVPTTAGTSSGIITATNAVGSATLTINILAGVPNPLGPTKVPVMDGLWLLPGVLAGIGLFARRRKG